MKNPAAGFGVNTYSYIFGGSAADPRIKADIAAARRVFAEWPTPIVAVGKEAGDAVPYPGATIATDFAWATTHPIV